MAEKVATFRWNSTANRAPEVAPTKKIGVTMPLLPPKFSVRLVETGVKSRSW